MARISIFGKAMGAAMGLVLLLGASAAADSVSRDLDRAAACVVVARTLVMSGDVADAGQAARATTIFRNASRVQSREIGRAGFSSDQASQIKSYYANKLAVPVRTLAALKNPASIASILGLCADFG